MNTITNKLFRITKFSIVTVILLSFSFTAHAEYYIATSGCECFEPVIKKCHYKRKKVHRKKCHRPRIRRCVPRCRGTSRVAFYYIAPAGPPCWGGEMWRPAGCGPCGRVVVPAHWRPTGFEYYQQMPIRYINDRIYDPDLATADDNAFFNPDLQINY